MDEILSTSPWIEALLARSTRGKLRRSRLFIDGEVERPPEGDVALRRDPSALQSTSALGSEIDDARAICGCATVTLGQKFSVKELVDCDCGVLWEPGDSVDNNSLSNQLESSWPESCEEIE